MRSLGMLNTRWRGSATGAVLRRRDDVTTGWTRALTVVALCTAGPNLGAATDDEICARTGEISVEEHAAMDGGVQSAINMVRETCDLPRINAWWENKADCAARLGMQDERILTIGFLIERDREVLRSRDGEVYDISEAVHYLAAAACRESARRIAYEQILLPCLLRGDTRMKPEVDFPEMADEFHEMIEEIDREFNLAEDGWQLAAQARCTAFLSENEAGAEHSTGQP